MASIELVISPEMAGIPREKSNNSCNLEDIFVLLMFCFGCSAIMFLFIYAATSNDVIGWLTIISAVSWVCTGAVYSLINEKSPNKPINF